MVDIHHYTQEEFEFIDDNIIGRTISELTELFNGHFGLKLRVAQIRAFAKNNGLASGVDCRFQPGRTSHNKGKKGISYPGMEDTQFKKGKMPWNYVPIGTERINDDGYVDIKVADGQAQHNWKGKHILIWEEHNGPVPTGHAVIFGDGNIRNFDPDNLLLVSRAQLVRMNQKRLIQSDVELTKTGILIADVYNKMGERKRTDK